MTFVEVSKCSNSCNCCLESDLAIFTLWQCRSKRYRMTSIIKVFREAKCTSLFSRQNDKAPNCSPILTLFVRVEQCPTLNSLVANNATSVKVRRKKSRVKLKQANRKCSALCILSVSVKLSSHSNTCSVGAEDAVLKHQTHCAVPDSSSTGLNTHSLEELAIMILLMKWMRQFQVVWIIFKVQTGLIGHSG